MVVFAVFFFFFFQAEDGIRDVAVTGVQTCALPISGARAGAARRSHLSPAERGGSRGVTGSDSTGGQRREVRAVQDDPSLRWDLPESRVAGVTRGGAMGLPESSPSCPCPRGRGCGSGRRTGRRSSHS